MSEFSAQMVISEVEMAEKAVRRQFSAGRTSGATANAGRNPGEGSSVTCETRCYIVDNIILYK
jgi:hypothetical protein